jgi:hypothetical protein
MPRKRQTIVIEQFVDGDPAASDASMDQLDAPLFPGWLLATEILFHIRARCTGASPSNPASQPGLSTGRSGCPTDRKNRMKGEKS